MVAGLPNSTAGTCSSHIILYTVLLLYCYKLYCFCISNLYSIREIQECRIINLPDHSYWSTEQYSKTCSSHIIREYLHVDTSCQGSMG